MRTAKPQSLTARTLYAELLGTLLREAPDGLPAAKADLIGRGKGWRDKLSRALRKTREHAPDAIDAVAAL